MKKILLISRCPPYPIYLGDRLIIWHLARELSQRGYIIDLLAQYNQPDDLDQIDRYQAYFRQIKLFPETQRSNFDYLQRLIRPSTRFPTSADNSFSSDMWNTVEHYLKQYDYDVVQCFGGISVYEFYPLFADIPSVITPYESYVLYLKRAIQQGDWRAQLTLPIVRQYEKWMFTPFDRTVVIAQPDKETLLSIQPQLNIQVISNGIDLDVFQLQEAQRVPSTLLFVGNFDYAPNQDAVNVLIEQIFPRVQQHIPDAQLQLVGNNPPEWMRNLASETIEVTGHVPDVQPYLAQATAFVCPLRIGAGLKNKVLEALAMGIPVIATPLSVDGIRVIHQESAWISKVENMAEDVVKILKDTALQHTLSQNGRKLIEAEYSWSQVATQYEQLYDEITS